MQCLKKLLLVVLVLILLINGLLMQIGLISELTYLRESYYRNLLAGSDFGSVINTLVDDQVRREVSAALPDLLSGLLSRAVLTVFDQQWAEEQAISVINQYLAYIKGREDNLDAEIDLKEKKGELGERLAAALQLVPGDALALIGLTGIDQEELAAELIDQLPLPDNLKVSELPAFRETGAEINRFARLLRQYRPFALYLPFLVFALVMFGLYKIYGTPVALKSAGMALLSAGVIFSLFLQALRSYYIRGLAEQLSSGELFEPEQLLSIMRHLIDRAAALSLYYALAGVIVMLAGGLAAWLQLLRRRKRRRV